MADNIVTGRKYRTKDAGNNWSTISFWTKSTDVEMNDGSILEDNFSDVKILNEQNAENLITLNNNNNANINNAPLYDDTIKYVKGDIIKQNGEFYYCNINMETPESWDITHWNEISSVPFKFGIDDFGNYGYIKAGTNSVTPFKGTMNKILLVSGASGSGSVSENIISQKCFEYHINPNKLTSSNFVMQMVGFATMGIYSQMGDKTPDASATLSSPNLVYNNGILSYNTGAWRQGGWNQNVWIHGARPGYDFYIDIQRPGAGNWTNGYHSDTSGTINETIQVSFDIAARCNIYMII